MLFKEPDVSLNHKIFFETKSNNVFILTSGNRYLKQTALAILII
jgi:hypothetical protein